MVVVRGFAAECVADVAAAVAAGFAAVEAPPVPAWIAAFVASDSALAFFALATSVARPFTPGACGGVAGAPESLFGFSTVNHAAANTSSATRAIRNGSAI